MTIFSDNGSKKTFVKGIPLFGLIILFVTIAGLAVDVSKADGDSFYTDIMRFEHVALKIHQNYVESMDSKLLMDRAIDGMFQILDPHSAYFEKKQFDELMIQTEGKFGGLGIQISIRDKVLTVMTPIPGTPAERAGIQSGDQILKINGKSTAGITIDEAVGKLRGEPGTDVTINVRRRGEKDLDYKITREIIHIKAVPYYGVFNDSIGYITLKTFSEDAGKEVGKAVRELLKRKIKGIVLDLRFNPGGLLPQAIEVAEKFLPQKSLVVYTRGRMQNQNHEYYVTENPILPQDIPMIVLVNYASASASEIVSGAIQDWDKGLIVGDTTFGKGSVQSILPIDEDHHLKLTTAFYYTPSGRCINKPENAIRGKGAKTDDNEDADADEGEKSKQSAAGAAKDTAAKKDTTIYKTNKGRTVFGGGGIVPDTVIKQPMPDFLVRSLFIKDAFFSFANAEYNKLKAKHVKIDSSFVLSNEIFADFQHYLDSTHFKFQNQAQMMFEDFKARSGIVVDTAKDTSGKKSDKEAAAGELTKPKWTKEDLESIKKASVQLDNLLTQDSKREFSENAPEIKKYVKDALLSRELGQDSDYMYRLKLKDDVQFKAALALFANKALYDKLLKPKGK
ncbi:MAG: S41 family peptidase [Chitinivibrionales bacterium]